MATLKCEICSGKLVGKPGGIFECEYCGVEYSTEWAKQKIQEIRGTVKVEGTVQVKGSVKVDGSVHVDATANVVALIKRGKMALEDRAWYEADKVFKQVLGMDAENAEAHLGVFMSKNAMASMLELECNYLGLLYHSNDKQVQRIREFAQADLKNWFRSMDEKWDDYFSRNDENLRMARGRSVIVNAKSLLVAVPTFDKKTIVSVRSDGTILGDELKEWAEIQSICSTGNHCVGLRFNGAVVAKGDNSKNQCDVSHWRNIKEIYVRGSETIGLCTDGTVVTTDPNSYMNSWKNITLISVGWWYVLGLREDGTVVMHGNHDKCKVVDWCDIVQISAKNYIAAGVKLDGTVVVTGDYASKCDVSNWRNIVDIVVDDNFVSGLCADGTVKIAGDSYAISKWKDTKSWSHMVSIVTDGITFAGLREDGTVVVSRGCLHIQASNMLAATWTEVVALTLIEYDLYGIRKDGTILTTSKEWQRKVEGWKLFDSIETISQEREVAKKRYEEKIAYKLECLNQELIKLDKEYSSLNSIFGAKRRREIETRVAEIKKELKELE